MPPADLSAQESVTWRAVVDTKPVDWWDAASVPLLVAYCRAVAMERTIAEQIHAFDAEWLDNEAGLKRYDKLRSMHEGQARTMASLATRMRLSQQSRYHNEKGAGAKAKTAAKPWERASGEPR